MMIQLNPPLPLQTPKGLGLAHFLIDYGVEADLVWVVFQDEDSQIWCWRNQEVRAEKNITFGRKTT
jgi:hypothetical protein